MILLYVIFTIILVWLLFELIVRWVAEKGIETDFYGSIGREEVQSYQDKFGIRLSSGPGWAHLGWVADPDSETYRIERQGEDGKWETIDKCQFGSWLAEGETGSIRILAVNNLTGEKRILGLVELPQDAFPSRQEKAFPVPWIKGNWQMLFKPQKTGHYVNDHCIFQDGDGNWRLLGITSQTNGDYTKERYFASASSTTFPPGTAFTEQAPVADFGELAWAPDVIVKEGKYHLFWSPHQLHHMTSAEGVHWNDHEIILCKPYHKFFRDAKIYQVADDQWLLYASGRGNWFSRIDIYQSFDLIHWQYIRPAIRCSWGSEKNFVTGSMESPFLIEDGNNYYLSITYNNESFFLSALLLQNGKFLNKKDYNNTLIFGSRNPYDFGRYRGKSRTPNLVAQIEAHAPVYIHTGGNWYLTTCGWPFVTTLTKGEVAWQELFWE